MGSEMCIRDRSNAAHRLFVSSGIKGFMETLMAKMDTADRSRNRDVPTTEPAAEPHKSTTKNAEPQFCIQFVQNWEEVVEHWENGCPGKNLMQPLKLMPRVMRKGKIGNKFLSMYCDRNLIATEYAKLGRNVFIDLYRPDDITMKYLKKNIKNNQNQGKKSIDQHGDSGARDMSGGVGHEHESVDADDSFSD